MIHRNLVPAALILVAAAVFATGINWGLPSRQGDPFLLGANYHGLYLEALTGEVPQVSDAAGADVVTPAGPADKIVPLNDTDGKKAQILCRYRLYSEQPDEMITFRSLSTMKPRQGDFDPRLYQYGGLWIYPVGAIIQAGGWLGWLEIADRRVYVGNPEIFGKFYVVARAYCALWGLAGVWAVYALIGRLVSAGRRVLPAIGTLCFIFMPVVVDMSHEAKPHLPVTALILLAVLAAGNYLNGRKIKWAWITGTLCGAAAGMALWGAVGLVIVPLLRRPRAIAFATIASVAACAAANPYVLYHLLCDPAVLASNLGNTAAMYSWGRPDQAIWNALLLAITGCGPAIFIAGLLGWGFGARSRPAGPGGILAVVAIAAAIPFALMARGKAGEYARFALLPDAALAIASMSAIARLEKRRAIQALAACSLLILTAAPSMRYLAGFVRDSGGDRRTSRLAESVALQEFLDARAAEYRRLGRRAPARPTLGVYADPAPYCLPLVDLDGWNIIRLPRDFDADNGPAVADAIVRPSEGGLTPISWADKGFDVTLKSAGQRMAYEASRQAAGVP